MNHGRHSIFKATSWRYFISTIVEPGQDTLPLTHNYRTIFHGRHSIFKATSWRYFISTIIKTEHEPRSGGKKHIHIAKL